MASLLAALALTQLLYLFFRSPQPASLCDASAQLSSALSRTRETVINDTHSISGMMHYIPSLLFSALGFFLFGFDAHAANVRTRQTGSTSSSVYNTRFENVTWDQATWEVRTTILDQGHYQSRLSIANGYLGINVAAAGPFFEQDVQVNGDNINGWPLFAQRQTFATIAGFYDQQTETNGSNFPWLNQYGGESVISGVPHWSGIAVDLGDNIYLDATVDNSTISNYSSTLNAKQGVATWSYTWAPENYNDVTFDIVYTLIAHKLYVNQGIVQLQITPSADANASIVNVIDGTSAVRTNFSKSGTEGSAIYTSVTPNDVHNVTAFIYATMEGTAEVNASSLSIVTDKRFIGVNDSSIAQAANAALKAGQKTTITKYVGGATSDGFVDPQRTARGACLQAMENGFDKSLASHVEEWAEVFPEDSVDNYTFPQNGTLPDDQYIVESAITAVLNEYYLLQNTISANALSNASNAPIDTWSIAVGGLTSDSYGGLVFWDAEIWMQPGLAVSHPQAVKQIANYRVERYGQAKANAQTAYQSSKNMTTFSSDAAVYSWTSGRSGNCTGTGPCFDYEYHINGDIAQEFANYWVASGDTQFFNESLFPVYNSVATFYSEVVTKNGSDYTLTNMTDPDEYANMVDNGGFTMALIADTLTNANKFRQMFGLPANETWDEIADNIFISRNAEAGIIEEYTGMNGSIVVKQADVVLNTFPLNFQKNYTTEDALNDLEFYAGKQSPDGPGMTYAIFSIVASAVEPAGCSAYTYQQYSEQPYARAPWFQFSEQLIDDYTANGGTHPAYPFLTGHGGANQVTVFGYLGLRLLPEYILHIDPTLPPQIPYLKYRTFYWQGWPISASANQTHTTLTRLSRPYKTANSTYATTAIPVQIGTITDSDTTFSLPPNGTLTFSNRPIANNTAIKGNIAQCQPAISQNNFEPGQFPFSAFDGAVSTKWQPSISNLTQALTVDLSTQPFAPVSSFHFDWAQAPPQNFLVFFHNDSATNVTSNNPDARVATSQQNVTMSSPYNETQESIITKYMSNTSDVMLDPPVWSGRYATLQVYGNQISEETNTTGCTVAEWGIIVNS